jgi:hypothetical protein
MRRAFLQMVLVGGLMVLVGGCSPSGEGRGPGSGSAPLSGADEAGLGYEEWALRYNSNASGIRTLLAQAVVRISYIDEEKQRQNEQGEGRLQFISPDQFALDIGKFGEPFFWLGSDSTFYWWFDLSGKQRTAFIGAHVNYSKSQARRVGVVVPPLDLLRLSGITPLPVSGGAVQKSADGQLIGLTVRIGGGGANANRRQRVWIDPQTALPTQIELYDSASNVELVSTLAMHDRIASPGGRGEMLATRIKISHPASDSLVTIDLADLQDGKDRLTSEAFDLAFLYKALRGDRAFDLDRTK